MTSIETPWDRTPSWKTRIISETRREKLRILMKRVSASWKVFSKNRFGMVGLVILVVFIVMAILPNQIVYLCHLVGGWESPWDPFEVVPDFDGYAHPPSDDHWLGTDGRGWDLFSRLIHGARVSLIIGFVAALVSMVLGAGVGILSAWWGGWKDAVLMRITDVFLVIPWLVLMIILATVLPGGPSVWKVIFVIGITGWSSTARIVRAQVFSVKERAFVERARAIGAGDMHIVRRHVFPNVFPLVFANAVLTIALSILSESTLSFIRLGPQSNDVVTWGNMLDDAIQEGALLSGFYWWIIMPGLCIVFVVLGFTFVGHALDDIFNPKLRKR
jgi:peptide/nickel transport system permease protein